MPLLILNLSCENVKYPARKHFEKTNTCPLKFFIGGFCCSLSEIKSISAAAKKTKNQVLHIEEPSISKGL